MSRRVIYFLQQPLHRYPPCLAQVCMLRDMGIQVVVLTSGCDAAAAELLAQKGIPCHYFRPFRFFIMPVQRALNMVNYAWFFWRMFRKYWTDETVLWVGSEKSILKMWPFLRKKRPMVLSALEFFEDPGFLQRIRPIAAQADILTACEPHRAQLMMEWWGLKTLPYVLRNKPYGEIPPKGAGSTPQTQAAIRQLQGKKVLLYQGLIFPERDLSLLARALRQGNSDFYLVLMGLQYADGNLEELCRIYDKTIYLGYFPAPLHLEVTAHAHIAVTYYQDDSINTRYCAPNKIHEYAGCGVPMLCNQLPGLMETVGAAGAAECVDFADPAAVMEALARMEADYGRYRQAALDFYRSVDNTPTMKEIVEDAFSRTKAERL